MRLGPRGAPVSAIPVGPEFEAGQQTTVLARVGETAALRCRVLRLADRAVIAILDLLRN